MAHRSANNDEEDYAKLIEIYLASSRPVYWLRWHSKCIDPDARHALGSALFKDEYLRDLTDPIVRGEVLEVFYQFPALMELVIADLADELPNDPGGK